VTRQSRDAQSGRPGQGLAPEAEAPYLGRRPVVSTGNPRLTVALPFSKVEIREHPDAVRDLAAMVSELGELVTTLAGQAAPDLAEASDRVAAEAVLLAHRLREGP
jgi:hypothetical protein